MKITSVLGREGDYPTHKQDELFLRSDDLAKRIFRKRTTSGQEVKVSLPRGSILRPGDVLFADEDKIVVIRVEPEWVLVVRPVTFEQITEAAHKLGNRHLPIQVYGSEIVAEYHPLLEKLFQGLQIPCAREQRTLERPFLHIFAPHIH